MNEFEAKNLLINHFEKDSEEGWIDLISERQYKSVHPVSGIEFGLDTDSFFFIVYGVPVEVDCISISQLSEEQKNEYRITYGVTKEGRVFMLEA